MLPALLTEADGPRIVNVAAYRRWEGFPADHLAARYLYPVTSGRWEPQERAALDALREHGPRVPGALVTADGSDQVKRDARARGYRVLTKPIKPASLRAFLAAQRSAHVAGHTP